MPIHERRLTDALLSRADDLLPHATTPVVLEEVSLGIGRTDLVVLDIDLDRVSLRRASGLRLASLQQALLLGMELGEPSEGLHFNPSFRRKATAALSALGWLTLLPEKPLTNRSLLVEAKVRDWKGALAQACRTSWAASDSAIAVPADSASRVPEQQLLDRGIGLVAIAPDGDVDWVVGSVTRPISFALDAWLGELVIRRLERPKPPREP